MRLSLPFPPSVNKYWRRCGNQYFISPGGKKFRKAVADEVYAAFFMGGMKKLEGRLSVVVKLFPPDRRRRDIDNAMKSLLDSLQHAGVYEDDNQIDRLEISRQEVCAGGRADVVIERVLTS